MWFQHQPTCSHETTDNTAGVAQWAIPGPARLPHVLIVPAQATTAS